MPLPPLALAPWPPQYLMLPFLPIVSPFLTTPCPEPISLTSLASKFKVPLGSLPASFGLSYQGETEAPEAQTSTVPSELRGEEEALQELHMRPVGSSTVLNS